MPILGASKSHIASVYIGAFGLDLHSQYLSGKLFKLKICENFVKIVYINAIIVCKNIAENN